MRLLSLPLAEALKIVDRIDKEAAELKHEVYKLCWYMRGSISINEGFMLSYEDRNIIGDIIKENLETTKNSGLPFF